MSFVKYELLGNTLAIITQYDYPPRPQNNYMVFINFIYAINASEELNYPNGGSGF
jgi:hypothetical protein